MSRTKISTPYGVEIKFETHDMGSVITQHIFSVDLPGSVRYTKITRGNRTVIGYIKKNTIMCNDDEKLFSFITTPMSPFEMATNGRQQAEDSHTFLIPHDQFGSQEHLVRRTFLALQMFTREAEENDRDIILGLGGYNDNASPEFVQTFHSRDILRLHIHG